MKVSEKISKLLNDFLEAVAEKIPPYPIDPFFPWIIWIILPLLLFLMGLI
jgi:hypothetical protein